LENINLEKNNINYYLPRLLSIRGLTSTPLVEDISNEASMYARTLKQRRKKNIKQHRPREERLKDYKIILDGKIMDMLSSNRSDDYKDWLYVGWILFNIGEGDVRV